MRIAVIGASGQLGREFERAGSPHEILPLDHERIEVTDLEETRRVLTGASPDAVVNLAAFHRVDDCETEPLRALEVNAVGARNVAEAAAEVGAAVVFVSTDYVFGGEAERREPYSEDDPAAPVNVYGVSKLSGERLVALANPDHRIVRSAGLYGTLTSRKGWTFPEMILGRAEQGEALRVVDDQVTTPTYTVDLAAAILDALEHGEPGVYHLTSGGECSWYEFARAVLEMAGRDHPVEPVPSTEFAGPARRPAYSALANNSAARQGLLPMRHWREALLDWLIEKGICNGRK